jgi:hypothetical protein
MARLCESSIDLTLVKNVCTVVIYAKRNVLAIMNIRRDAWKNADNHANMRSAVYVARSPVLLVRNHADGAATTTLVLSHVVRYVYDYRATNPARDF